MNFAKPLPNYLVKRYHGWKGCDFLVAVYIFENMIIFGTFFRFNP